MKICLACSAGGHLNQLRQLKQIYSKHDYYFVTPQNIYSQYFANKNEVYFVDDVSYGLLKRNIKNWFILFHNFFKSLKMLLKEKPDVIITTGAGPALWTCYLGKLFGKKIIFIETIAHIYTPSLFGKLVYHLADLVIVQWKTLLNYYPKAKYGGFIFDFSEANKNFKNKNKYKTLITVGTHGSFDRLLIEAERLIKLGIIKGEIIAQIGNSNFSAQHIKIIKNCFPQELEEYMNESGIVITHGGSGSIINAILKGCTVIAVPRKAELGEHYDDHQVEIIKAFEEIGLILGVDKMENLEEVFKRSIDFKAKTIANNSRVLLLVEQFLNSLR